MGKITTKTNDMLETRRSTVRAPLALSLCPSMCCACGTHCVLPCACGLHSLCPSMRAPLALSLCPSMCCACGTHCVLPCACGLHSHCVLPCALRLHSHCVLPCAAHAAHACRRIRDALHDLCSWGVCALRPLADRCCSPVTQRQTVCSNHVEV